MAYGTYDKTRAEQFAQELTAREPEYRFEVCPNSWAPNNAPLTWGVVRWQQNYAPEKGMPERNLGFVWRDSK